MTPGPPPEMPAIHRHSARRRARLWLAALAWLASIPGAADDRDLLPAARCRSAAGELSFTTAALPQGQATARDKAYLAGFLPLPGASIWPGRLDAYRRPIPLRSASAESSGGGSAERRVPDRDRSCVDDDSGGCHLWSAAQRLLEQAAAASQISAGDYNLGPGEDQRRVYYGRGSGGGVPRERVPLERPATEPAWRDLLGALEICPPEDAACAQGEGTRARGAGALDFLHRVKVATDPTTGETIEYLLGDIFHSDPVVVGHPDTFRYWVDDVGGNGSLPFRDACRRSPRGYRCFFAKHQLRRKMLLVGSGDGQLHAFDAGVFRGACRTDSQTGRQRIAGTFDDGSGRELFSFMPRAALPDLVRQAEQPAHRFTVDGPIARGDVFIDPSHRGVPDPEAREWRTVVVGGMRDGGAAYFALDLTQPDALAACDGTSVLPHPLPGARSYVPSCTEGGCAGTDPFPKVLWEFTDREDCGRDAGGAALTAADGRCDSDRNGLADLGPTWSRPAIARIRVLEDGGASVEPADRYVAIFGGGSDPERKGAQEATGNHIFMVDLETGRAIFKRRVPDGRAGVPSGSVPADLAVVDLDRDGYAETVYFGTTGGFVYKMDLRRPSALEPVPGAGLKLTDPSWSPFPVFDTGGRPIYVEPAVIFVASLGRHALVFGTGDREDLGSGVRREGRVYTILDQGFSAADAAAGLLPRTESAYREVTHDARQAGSDHLRRPPHGWYLRLAPEERVLARPTVLAGVTVVASFDPSGGTGAGACGPSGASRVTVVSTVGGEPVLGSGELSRPPIPGLISTPFVALGPTQNRRDEGIATAEDRSADLKALIAAIRRFMPAGCRFANHTVDIRAVRDDTGIEALAAAPVCAVESNWRDF